MTILIILLLIVFVVVVSIVAVVLVVILLVLLTSPEVIVHIHVLLHLVVISIVIVLTVVIVTVLNHFVVHYGASPINRHTIIHIILPIKIVIDLIDLVVVAIQWRQLLATNSPLVVVKWGIRRLRLDLILLVIGIEVFLLVWGSTTMT